MIELSVIIPRSKAADKISIQPEELANQRSLSNLSGTIGATLGWQNSKNARLRYLF